MAADVFLTTTDLRELSPVPLEEQGRLDHQQALVLLSSKYPDLAELFAEPVFTRDDDGELISASWYVSVDRDARRLNKLQPVKRERVEEGLRVKLEALAQARLDPELVAVIDAMTVLPDDQSVFAIGTSPILVNWGMQPKSRAAFIGSGLAVGALSGYVTSRQLNEGGEAVSEKGAAGDVEENQASVKADVPADDQLAADEEAAGGLSGSGDQIETTEVEAYEPIYHRTWFRYLVYGILILLILWLLCLLFRPYLKAYLNPPPSATDLHAPVLKGLEDERDRLRGLLNDPCSPQASRAILHGPAVGSIIPGAPEDVTQPAPEQLQPREEAEAQPSTPEQLPAPPQRSDPQTTDVSAGNEPIPLSELARRLESSIAFVIAAGREGSSTGSGFFIANDTIMTNSHVVDGAQKIYVTSKHLGLVREAQIVVQTPRPRPGTRDYAILKLVGPIPNVQPLLISDQLKKLDRVVAVGYPGALTRRDSQLNALKKGDATASPEAIFTHGLVNVIFRDKQPSIIAHSADISQGNSGGPLVDECNRVVGINTFISQDQLSGRRSKFSLVGADMISFLSENNVSFNIAEGQCGGQISQASPVQPSEPGTPPTSSTLEKTEE